MAAFKRDEEVIKGIMEVLTRGMEAWMSQFGVSRIKWLASVRVEEASERVEVATLGYLHSYSIAELEFPAQKFGLSHSALWKWSEFTPRIDEVRKGRTRPAKSLTCFWKPRNHPGSADHMQIFLDDGALWQPFRRSFAESMQISKNHCNNSIELSSEELIFNPGCYFAPRNPGDSKGCNSGQKREEDLMTRFALIFKHRLHDALEPILAPVACGLRSQGEEARKERERLLALEKQKLALNLKELELLKRRRAGRFQRSRRASNAFPRRRRQGQGHRLRFPWKPST